MELAEGFGASGVQSTILTGIVNASAVYDDGSGAQLYVGGHIDVAGDVRASGIASWNGASWSSLDGGISGSSRRVYALHTFDDGSGPALYVGGSFNAAGANPAQNVARWTASGWTPLDGIEPQGFVYDFEVFDDGSGPALYAGGWFGTVAGQVCRGLARWNGTTWTPVGAGAGGQVFELQTFDDGAGAKLYIGGNFTLSQQAAGNYFAWWDGTQFGNSGAGLDHVVRAMAVYDDGSGAALYVGGSFNTANGASLPRLAKWNGSSWSSAGDVHGAHIEDLLEFDDGSGAKLYAAGSAGGVTPAILGPYLQILDNGMWSELGGGTHPYGELFTLEEFDGGSGAKLHLGGRIQSAGGVHTDGVAAWNGAQFEALGAGDGRWGAGDALTTHDGGSGLAVYADDGFRPSQFLTLDAVERIDSQGVTRLGERSDGDVRALASYGASGGAQLYATGSFTRFGTTLARGVASWNGVGWAPVGGNLSPIAGYALGVFDLGAGPELVLGGLFTDVAGVPATNIAAWNGSTWRPLGLGLNDLVQALAMFDDGSGPHLYAGGRFTKSGGVNMARIAKWDGALWLPLGAGASGVVETLATFDDGSGEQLYAGGGFVHIGGVSFVFGIARWNGSAWSALPSGGANATVRALQVFDDGTGAKLYAGGDFSTIGGAQPTRGLAGFDGSVWRSPLGSDVQGGVSALSVFDDGVHVPSLWLAGAFLGVGERVSIGVAHLQPKCPCPPAAYCTAKVNSQGCTPSIFATGSPSISANTLRVRAANVLNQKAGVLFWGLAPNAAPFQGGVLCVHAPTFRTSIQNSGGAVGPDDCSGNYVFHFSGAYMTSHGLTPGQRVYGQYWTRDPASPSSTGLTDALSFVACP